MSPPKATLEDEIHLRVLKLLQANPALSQRELAEALGISLGKTNYCLQALMARGLVKARNFHQRKDKRAYAYLLTPEGVAAKAALTTRFLKRKMAEYDLLRAEIEALASEANWTDGDAGTLAEPVDAQPGATGKNAIRSRP